MNIIDNIRSIRADTRAELDRIIEELRGISSDLPRDLHVDDPRVAIDAAIDDIEGRIWALRDNDPGKVHGMNSLAKALFNLIRDYNLAGGAKVEAWRLASLLCAELDAHDIYEREAK